MFILPKPASANFLEGKNNLFDSYLSSGSRVEPLSSLDLNISPVEPEKVDDRLKKLQLFFRLKGSILEEHAQTFITYADKYGLDYRLLPAISGIESTFAKAMPKNSFNAFGWNKGNQYFDSWDSSISHISQALRKNYLDKGRLTVAQIGAAYCPNSPSWIINVNKFVDQIENTKTGSQELSYINTPVLTF